MVDRRLRGEIVRIRFDPTLDSEQAGERPGLVLSPDFINERAPIIIVAPLTTRKTDRVFAFEAVIDPPEGGLPQRSKVMLLHVRVVDKARITGRFGSVGDETMTRVEEALRIVTGLTRL